MSHSKSSNVNQHIQGLAGLMQLTEEEVKEALKLPVDPSLPKLDLSTKFTDRLMSGEGQIHDTNLLQPDY